MHGITFLFSGKNKLQVPVDHLDHLLHAFSFDIHVCPNLYPQWLKLAIDFTEDALAAKSLTGDAQRL